MNYNVVGMCFISMGTTVATNLWPKDKYFLNHVWVTVHNGCYEISALKSVKPSCLLKLLTALIPFIVPCNFHQIVHGTMPEVLVCSVSGHFRVQAPQNSVRMHTSAELSKLYSQIKLTVQYKLTASFNTHTM